MFNYVMDFNIFICFFQKHEFFLCVPCVPNPFFCIVCVCSRMTGPCEIPYPGSPHIIGSAFSTHRGLLILVLYVTGRSLSQKKIQTDVKG